MGLTFKKQDDLEKMLDKFAVMPDDFKKNGGKPKDKNKDKNKKGTKK